MAVVSLLLFGGLWSAVGASNLAVVTCGSVVKLLNTRHNVRLHSHDVRYGSGTANRDQTKENILEEFSKVTEGLVDVILYNQPNDKKKKRKFCFLEYEDHKSAAQASYAPEYYGNEDCYDDYYDYDYHNYHEGYDDLYYGYDDGYAVRGRGGRKEDEVLYHHQGGREHHLQEVEVAIHRAGARRGSRSSRGVLHNERLSFQRSSGSGQQSVTGVTSVDDSNSYWRIRGKTATVCERGTPVRCGQPIRLTHVNTGRNLHSHHFTSPLSGNQEVSAFGEEGEGDYLDDWTVLCNGPYWVRDGEVRFKHSSTEVLLSVTGEQYGRPISGQKEVHGMAQPSQNNYWKAMEGIFMKPSELLKAEAHHAEL
ncbi:Stromal cell-derived factor 2 [Pteropus alecto]|uniref:Stromal cell-derived factor 2 n=1 Tax=Pteropus alecto TaxID=9402 RepID=L5JSX4_PTEAL|nr:Stromal cell-derived factor 2 [Pteropus alecto]